MKTVIKLYFLFFLLTSCVGQQITETDQQEKEIPKSLSLNLSNFTTPEILRLLFDGKYDKSSESIRWKPYPKETIVTQEDGFCTTFLDTILYVNNESNSIAVVVLHTSDYFSGNIRPSIGIAMFTKLDNEWQLESFDRSAVDLGSYGDAPENLKIVQFGKDHFALSLSGMEGAGGGPVNPIYECWLNLDKYEFGNIILDYYLENSDEIDLDIIKYKSIEVINDTKNEYFRIKLHQSFSKIISEEITKPKNLPSKTLVYSFGKYAEY